MNFGEKHKLVHNKKEEVFKKFSLLKGDTSGNYVISKFKRFLEQITCEIFFYYD
jgi:hypothetical protein